MAQPLWESHLSTFTTWITYSSPGVHVSLVQSQTWVVQEGLKQAEEEGESLARAKVSQKSERQVRGVIGLLAPVKANKIHSLAWPVTTPRPHPDLGWGAAASL